MVTGSTPIASAGQLGVLLADDDFDDVAEIVGAAYLASRVAVDREEAAARWAAVAV